jgi:hypothetical protein
MTLHQATNPDALSMMSFIRLQGPQIVEHRIAEWIREVDMLSGGKTPPEVLAMLSGMVMQRMKHRSVASVMMALRDGLNYTDDDGRIYGSITWTKIAMWLDRHEEKVLALAHDSHASQVTKNDNYDRSWLDEQEAKSTKVQDRKDRLIDSLRKQLDKK